MSQHNVPRIEREYPTAVRSRRDIDELIQKLSKAVGRNAARLRRRIRKAVAESVAAFRAQPIRDSAVRRQENVSRRERRHDKILASRDPVAFAERKKRRDEVSGLVRPVFEQ